MAERLGANFAIDITQLQAGLRTANKLIRESKSEFQAAAAGMDDWTKSEDGLRAKINSLNSITDIQRKKVDALQKQYDSLIDKGLDPASDRAVQLRTQINNETAALNKNQAELKRTEKALDDLGDQAQETGKEIEKSGSGWAKFGDAAKAAAKVAMTAIAAIGAGVVALTKQAVENYAEYEQLIGGVETLFGTGGKNIQDYAKSVGKSVDEVKADFDKLSSAQDTVIKNASNAYKTAGMSANDYMSNVTSFSAALISSLGGDTEKAAAVADRAMTDISDNANKMGSDMQMIVDTYQSLSRGNFQMLDNLKLGYGGTKTEMERLIADAAKMTDVQKELNLTVKDGDMSFSNMINAISVIQKEMGITGTTAKEASETISGSVNSMKAAWQNLLTGVADDTQDFDLLINNFVDSFETAAKNLLPRIATALGGIVKLVEALVPQIPPLLDQLLPIAVEGIMNVVHGIVNVLPQIVDTILDVIPQLVDAILGMLPTLQDVVFEIIIRLIDAISDLIPKIVDAVLKVVPQLTRGFINAIPKLLNAAIKFIMAIVRAIPVVVQEIAKQTPELIQVFLTMLTENIPVIFNAAINLLMAIVNAIPVILNALMTALPEIINTLISTLFNSDTIQSILDGAIELLMGIVDAIPVIITALVETLPQIFETIISTLFSEENLQTIINGAIQLLMGIITAIPQILVALVNALPQIITTIVGSLTNPNSIMLIIKAAVELLLGLVKAIPQVCKELLRSIPQIVTTIVNGIKEGIPEMVKAGGDLISGLWDGIKDSGKWLKDKIGGFLGGVVDNIKGFFGIASPSKLMKNLVGKNLALGIGEGFADNIGKVNDQINNAIRLDDININRVGNLGNLGTVGGGQSVVVNQYNTFSQAHSRYEIYKAKQQTAAAVRLALGAM